MNETIEEQLYKKNKKDIITKLKKNQVVIIQTKIKMKMKKKKKMKYKN